MSGSGASAGLPLCGACGLYKVCKSPKMESSGKGRRSVLLVGEAPGEDEDEEGTQFVGRAGECLRGMLDEIGIELDDCWKTNAAICRPPENEIELNHIKYCRPNVLNTIKKLQPKVIIPLGLSAVNSVLGLEWGDDLGKMGRWPGWEIPIKKYNAWVCPTWHPSYVLRQKEDPVLVNLVKKQLASAFALEGKTPVAYTKEDLIEKVEVIKDLRLARMRIKDLSRKSGYLAFDYEATGLKPERAKQKIVTVSFCYEGEDTFVCPVDESLHDVISRVLLNEKLLKIASNLKYEERWSRKKLGHGVKGWDHDTMLVSHVMDNRKGITSIKFLAFVYLGIGDYARSVKKFMGAKEANEINRMASQPSLLYCGIDSLVEFMVAMIQKKKMGWI